MNSLQYFVYYKVDAARVEDLRKAVDTLFSEVKAATGIQGVWQRRRDDPKTFMETYSGVVDADAFDRALNLALEKSGFPAFGIPRVTEIFQCA